MTRAEKREMRIDRYKSLALNARVQSNNAAEQSVKMGDVIPFGQPIHGQRDRNYREKIWNKMGQSVQLGKKAEYYAEKAQAAESNNAIYLEDDDCVERLQEKIDKLVKTQEMMKGANKILSSKKFSDIEKLEKMQGIGFSEISSISYLTPDRFGRFGFPSYSLTNNNARIKTAKERILKAIKLKSTETKEYTIGEVNVVENSEDNRLQLFFDGKPDEETRAKLKHNGFRWAPSNSCWQSYLNRTQIERVKTIFEE